MANAIAMAFAQWYLLLSVLGIPFFAIFAVLEKMKNPMLTRNSTEAEISDRVQACSICAVLCFFIAVGLTVYLGITFKKEDQLRKEREAMELQRLRDGIQHQSE